VPPFIGVVFPQFIPPPGGIFKARAHHQLFVGGFDHGRQCLFIIRNGKGYLVAGQSIAPSFEPASGLNCSVPVLAKNPLKRWAGGLFVKYALKTLGHRSARRRWSGCRGSSAGTTRRWANGTTPSSWPGCDWGCR